MATTKTGDAELRSSICKSKYYAYNLIANDSIMEGIAILDSLWETYHIDRTILVAKELLIINREIRNWLINGFGVQNIILIV